jgi:hypothetical protein
LRAHRGVAEIGEHPVDAQPVELQILLHGVQPVIRSEETRVRRETYRDSPLKNLAFLASFCQNLINSTCGCIVEVLNY